MEKLTIDNQGDICLIATVTSDGTQIGFVVNSTVLRFASPVFAALVGHKFAEGQALSQRKPGEAAIEVHLPDDDAEGLQTLLSIIHQLPVYETMALEQLTKLARLVDKYQCYNACSFHAATWVKSNLRNQGFSKKVPEYLGLAIAFRNQELFNVIATGLALTIDTSSGTTRLDHKIRKTVLADLVPANALSLIAEAGRAYINDIPRNVNAEIIRIAHKTPSHVANRAKHESYRYCHHDEQLLANYYSALAAKSLLAPTGGTPIELLGRLPEVAVELATRERNSRETTAKDGGSCSSCTFLQNSGDNMRSVALRVLSGGPKLSLSDALSAKTVPKPLFGSGDSSSGNLDAVQLLFGEILGKRFVDNGDGNSFQRQVQEGLIELRAA